MGDKGAFVAANKSAARFLELFCFLTVLGSSTCEALVGNGEVEYTLRSGSAFVFDLEFGLDNLAEISFAWDCVRSASAVRLGVVLPVCGLEGDDDIAITWSERWADSKFYQEQVRNETSDSI